MKLIEDLLENLGGVLKHVIYDRVQLKHKQVVSAIEFVSKCVTNVLVQMDDINCPNSVSNSIYQKIDFLRNYLQYEIFKVFLSCCVTLH